MSIHKSLRFKLILTGSEPLKKLIPILLYTKVINFNNGLAINHLLEWTMFLDNQICLELINVIIFDK
jgi:hypothetical protein